ncbi:MAG: type VI secretion system tube protein Hcp [Gemmataceae bacterium]|nr:type VI secretion system tube protein Hcp [Gemmataceae bacterium]
MPMYMKWGAGPDIKGEVTESSHVGWLAIDSVSFGASRASGVEVGSGQEKRHRNPPTISDIQISRGYDAASPLLFNASVAGEPTNVWIVFLEPAGAQDKPPNLYLQLSLRACVLTSYSTAGGGEKPGESLSLSYTAINIDYTPYDETDKAGKTTRGFFDLITGKCTAWK